MKKKIEKKEEEKKEVEKKVILKTKFNPIPYAKKILEKYKLIYDDSNRFWIYENDEGIWTENAEKVLRHFIRTELLFFADQSDFHTKEIINYLKEISYVHKTDENKDENIIAFKNCLANIDTLELIPFDSKYFITTKLNIEIENIENPSCPKIDKFFSEAVGENKKSILYDLMAYCFFRGYPLQLMFIFHGSGKNSKTTVLNFFIKILGKENISTETPQDLTNNDFSKGNLWNKLANISPDLPYEKLKNSSVIKSLCGNDVIKCNRKFKDTFVFTNYAKIIFSANELPIINDKTDALARRIFIIQFNNKVQKPIKDYENILLKDKKEMKNFAWICLNRLKAMKKRNWEFEIRPNPEEQIELYEELSNPLLKFLKDETIMTKENDPSKFIFKFRFENEFSLWCKKNGFRIWNPKEVNTEMSHLFEVERKRKWLDENNNKMWYAWIGINFKNLKNDFNLENIT